MARIYVYDNILETIIAHSKQYQLECGGFLYGNINKYDAFIQGLYYEDIRGSEIGFVFSPSYIYRAKRQNEDFKLKYNNSVLLGTYHSHPMHHAVFSDVDRNLERKFVNGIALVYSPLYNELSGDLIKSNYIISSDIKVIDKNDNDITYTYASPKIITNCKAIKI